ncbi:MAG: Ig-like domain-containing protein, partial [Gammaproteobacteria bacterium]|nr:Ig-like domain-containing protein [Gammaproteobacteria bacterium]
IDPATVDANSFLVRDNSTGVSVPGTYSVSSDGRLITFVADAPLAVNRSHSVFFANRGIRDLSGNLLTGGAFSFTTASEEDSEAPQVLGVSPAGLSDVPTNVQVMVLFDEPIQANSVVNVTLNDGGRDVVVKRTLSNGNRTLVLSPLVPLAQSTLHSVTVEGVLDLAGNALPVPDVTTFTTETGVDLIRLFLTQVEPFSGAVVGTNVTAQVSFSERINPLTVTPTFISRTATLGSGYWAVWWLLLMA